MNREEFINAPKEDRLKYLASEASHLLNRPKPKKVTRPIIETEVDPEECLRRDEEMPIKTPYEELEEQIQEELDMWGDPLD